MPLRLDALAPAARDWLAPLAARPWAADFYLAGGAALALHLGHRQAHALDLMSASNRLLPADRRDLLYDVVALESATRVETARDGYLYLHLPGPTALRLFWYPYPLAAPLAEADGLAVASPLDLGLMKLGALISRGTRADFVDLYLLCRELPLDALLARAGDKFGHVGDFALQAWKALADTSDADDDAMPSLRTPTSWDEVRAWAHDAAARGGRQALGR
ncbi:MAG: hypothetical protein NDJ75_06250 [Thermoanaerobaculia bacterium]|nr:hypothetical protein [Thermoanaerobaculia bacterium]